MTVRLWMENGVEMATLEAADFRGSMRERDHALNEIVALRKDAEASIRYRREAAEDRDRALAECDMFQTVVAAARRFAYCPHESAPGEFDDCAEALEAAVRALDSHG